MSDLESNPKVWAFGKIASDFVKNLEPMPNDVKVKELTALVRVIKLQAEVEQLKRVAPENVEEIAMAKAKLLIARLDTTFHNHILITEE
jgi:hypothetical protein